LEGRAHEALAAFESALSHAPERETSLFLAATLALRMKRHDAARAYADRAIRVNLWRWQYHQILADVDAQSENWRAAIEECQKVLALDAANLATRRLLVTSHLRTGDRASAQAEFAVLLPMMPPDRQESVRRWFEREAR
jgi:tetratricopeptide (TPR) repeat protein